MGKAKSGKRTSKHAPPTRPKPTPPKKKAALSVKEVVRDARRQPKSVPAKKVPTPTPVAPKAEPKKKSAKRVSDDEAKRLLGLARAESKPANKVPLLEQASALARGVDIRTDLRGQWAGLARAALNTSEWEACAQYYAHGYGLMRDVDMKDEDRANEYANLMNECGYALHQLRRLDEATAICERARQIFVHTKSDIGVARVIYHLSGIVFDRGDLQGATDLAQQSVDMARAAKDLNSTALHLYALSRSLFEQGKSIEAEQAARDGIDQARKINWGNLEGNLVNMLANIKSEDGQLEEADEQYCKAIELFKTAKLPIHAAITLSNRGNIAFDRGYLEESKQMHTSAIADLKKQKDERSCAISLTARAGVHTEAGAYAAAQKDLDEAIEILTRIGQARRVAFVRNAYARLAETRGDLDEALAHYAETEMSLENVNDHLAIARGLYAQAGVQAEAGDPGTALALLARADEIHSPAAALAADAHTTASETVRPRRSHPGDVIALVLRDLAAARIDAARARAGAADAAALVDQARALLARVEPECAISSEVRRVAHRLRRYVDRA